MSALHQEALEASTLEEQIAALLERHGIDTLQINAVREEGAARFYAVAHGSGLCAYGDLLNLPTVAGAAASAIDALNAKRTVKADVPALAPMGVEA